MRKKREWMRGPGAAAALMGASLAALMPPAAAQTAQTPENAQKFISQMLLGASAARGFDGERLYGALPVQSASGSGCTTQVWTGDFVLQVDWARIRSISPVGQSVLKLGGVVPYVWRGDNSSNTVSVAGFDLSSSDAAQRVQVAFEVLRKACDPASGLGF